MNKFKRYIPILLWFIIITKLAYSGILISIDKKNWLINLCQLIALCLIILQSYFLLEMLISKKVNLEVVKQIQQRKSTKRPRVFFVARKEDHQEHILSKVSSTAEIRIGMTFKGYYTSFNKLKVVEPYVIKYRILLLLLCIIFISSLPFTRHLFP